MKNRISAAALLLLGFAPLCRAQEVPLQVSAYHGYFLNYAQKTGYFQASGLSLNIIISSQASRQLYLGQADAALGDMSGPVEQYMKGAEVRILARLYPSPAFYGVSRYPYTEAGSIKTAVSGGKGGATGSHIKAMLRYLGGQGVKVDESNLSDNARYALLEAGKADLALISSAELLSRIRAEKKYYVIEPGDAYKGGSYYQAVITTKNAMDTKGPQLEKFVSACVDAVSDIAASSAPFVAYLVSEEGLGPAQAESIQAAIAAGAGAGFAPSLSEVDTLADQADVSSDTYKGKRKAGRGLLFPDYAVKAVKSRAAGKNKKP